VSKTNYVGEQEAMKALRIMRKIRDYIYNDHTGIANQGLFILPAICCC
jgi:hypothetical protein